MYYPLIFRQQILVMANSKKSLSPFSDIDVNLNFRTVFLVSYKSMQGTANVHPELLCGAGPSSRYCWTALHKSLTGMFGVMNMTKYHGADMC